MAYDFAEFKRSSEATLSWLKKEYAGIRTGLATPSILDGILVDAYGSPMSIHELGTVAIEDAKTLRITVWDKDVVKNIDQAIRESNLGLSVTLDALGARVSFPALTSERRAALSKIAKEKLEEARIKVRTVREQSLDNLDRRKRDGDLSEDDKFRLKHELQKLVEETNQKLEELALKKEREISA